MALNIRRTTRTAQGFIEPLLEVDKALPLQMVLIPGGTFLMGSPTNEHRRSESEGPQHAVTVPSFFMGRFPVTQAQWSTVANLPKINQKLEPSPSEFKGSNRPVERISWYEAMEFCDRLAQYTHRPYRLPTEAEWEYACRADSTTPFYFGKTLITSIANFDGRIPYVENGSQGEFRQETTPVNHFGIANAFGLSDMHGNVYEWCLDHYHYGYEGAPEDGSVWLSSEVNEKRCLRGGSWGVNPWYCRSAFRNSWVADNRDVDIGFRVCCSAPKAFQ
jgi:formylglycine-generating enzyme required for sulfatase activity